MPSRSAASAAVRASPAPVGLPESERGRWARRATSSWTRTRPFVPSLTIAARAPAATSARAAPGHGRHLAPAEAGQGLGRLDAVGLDEVGPQAEGARQVDAADVEDDAQARPRGPAGVSRRTRSGSVPGGKLPDTVSTDGLGCERRDLVGDAVPDPLRLADAGLVEQGRPAARLDDGHGPPGRARRGRRAGAAPGARRGRTAKRSTSVSPTGATATDRWPIDVSTAATLRPLPPARSLTEATRWDSPSATDGTAYVMSSAGFGVT